MIIDAHTHIYPDTVAEKALKTVIENLNGNLTAHTDGTYESLLDSMDRAGIDLSIVLPIATDLSHGNGILDWVRQEAGRSSRLIFFGSVHPYDPDYKSVIREFKELGVRGIKLHPGYQGFPVDSRDVFGVYEEILKSDLVIVFHSGLDPSLPDCDFASVERISRFMDDFQGSKIILAHAGGEGAWGRALELMAGKRCYYDFSYVLENIVASELGRELVRENEDYFVFGTDSPWRDQKRYVDLIRDSEFLTEGQKQKIFYKNIAKLIKIPQI